MKTTQTTTKRMLIITVICFLFSASCSKSDKPGEVNNIQENPATSRFRSIKEIIKAVDKDKLDAFITKLKAKYNSRVIDGFPVIPDDVLLEEEAQAVLQPTNDTILTYLNQNYPHLGSTELVVTNDPDFTYFAQVYSIAEQSGFITPIHGTTEVAARQIPAWLRCTVDLVMGYFDVRGLISELGNFEFSTVWRAVKGAIKKYVGFIAAAILIYDITTECIL